MKVVKYIIGFILGVLGTYLFCALVSWEVNPGEWSALWRFLGVLFGLFWGHIVGAAVEDHQFVKISLSKY